MLDIAKSKKKLNFQDLNHISQTSNPQFICYNKLDHNNVTVEDLTDLEAFIDHDYNKECETETHLKNKKHSSTDADTTTQQSYRHTQ